jgi:hypothetical protein
MALDLAAPNFSGTAALAGRGISNLDLDVPGALGLQALQLVQAKKQANQRAALERMQLQNQAAQAMGQQGLERQRLGLLSQQGQQEQQYKQQLMQQEGRQQQGSLQAKLLGLQQRDLQHQDNMMIKKGGLDIKRAGLEQNNMFHSDKMDVAKQKMLQEAQKQEMEKLSKEKEETLRDMGAFASYALTSLDQAKSPDEAQQITNAFLPEAVKNGYITEEQAEAFRKLPLTQRKNALQMMVYKTKTVADYKKMHEINNPKEDKSGFSMTTDSKGNVTVTQGLTTANQTKNQEEITNKELALTQLEQIEDGYKPEYFTYMDSWGSTAAATAEKSKGVPVLGKLAEDSAKFLTGKTSEERKVFLQERKAYMNKIDQMFHNFKKEMSGTAVSDKEMNDLKDSFISGKLSPSEFKGALQQLREKYKGEVAYRKNSLVKGQDVTESLPPEIESAIEYNVKTYGYTKEEAISLMRQRGMIK